MALRKQNRIDRGIELDHPPELRQRIVKILTISLALIAIVLIIQAISGQNGSDVIVPGGANRYQKDYQFPGNKED